MIFKISMDRQGLKVFKVSINDDPWVTFTNFKTRSKLSGKHLQERLSTGLSIVWGS